MRNLQEILEISKTILSQVKTQGTDCSQTTTPFLFGRFPRLFHQITISTEENESLSVSRVAGIF